MSRRLVLYLVFFGVLELGLTTFFSVFIWTSLIDNNYYLPTLINLSLLGITLIYGIGQFFYRTKAKAYLYGLVLRIFFAGSVFIICQIGYIAFEPNLIGYIWLAISIVVYICAIAFWIKKEKIVWDLTLEGLKKCGKLNVKKGYFKICEGFYSATGKPFNPSEKGALVGYTIAIGVFLLKLLEMYSGENFMKAFLRFGFVFMSYVAGMAFGKFLLYTVEIRKLEKKLGIEFVTEFGEMNDNKKVKTSRKIKKSLRP